MHHWPGLTGKLVITLTPAQRGDLKARAHSLNPVASIAGKGLAPTVVAEIDRCLKAHELIKVRVYGAEREDRDALFAELCELVHAAPVQHIGNILVLYRANPEEAVKPVRAKIGIKTGTKGKVHGKRQGVERGELRNTRRVKASPKPKAKPAAPKRRRTLGYRLD